MMEERGDSPDVQNMIKEMMNDPSLQSKDSDDEDQTDSDREDNAAKAQNETIIDID